MLPASLLQEFKDTVTIAPYMSQNAYGEASYGPAVPYPARVEVRSRRIAGSGGVELTARGRVFLATIAIPSVKDQLTLPAWAAPTQPPILDVQPHLGDGLDHIVIFFGV